MAGIDDEARQDELISKLDPDFVGLLDVKEVEKILKAKLALLGIKTISRFSAVADTRETMREFTQASLSLDPARVPEDIVKVAAMGVLPVSNRGQA